MEKPLPSLPQQREPRVGCGVAIVVDGRLLLIRRLREPEAGCWSLPGGKIDLFETAAEAAAREVLEETGLTICCEDLLCFTDQIDREGKTHWVAPVYLTRSAIGEPHIVEPEKHDALGWFALDALPDPLALSVRAALAALGKRGFE